MPSRRDGWRHRTRSRRSPRNTKSGKAADCAVPTGAAVRSSVSCTPRSATGRLPTSDAREIIRLLDKIAAAADHVRGKPLRGRSGDGQPHPGHRAQKIMNWHATRSRRFRSPVCTRHGANRRGGAGTPSAFCQTTSCDALWQATEAGEGPFDRLVQFLLLTAARRGEAAAMTWQEIDGTDWMLPASPATRPEGRPGPAAQCSGAGRAGAGAAAGGLRLCLQHRRPQCASTDLTTSNGSSTRSAASAAGRLHDLRRTARSLMSHAILMRIMPNAASATSLAAFAASMTGTNFAPRSCAPSKRWRRRSTALSTRFQTSYRCGADGGPETTKCAGDRR